MIGYTLLWIGWGAAFLLIEGAALLDKTPGGTLSEHIWRWFAVKDPRPTARTWALRTVLLTGLVWLTGHLAFGWWTP